MESCIVATIATLVVAAGTFYVSICSPLLAAPRSTPRQPYLAPRPLMKRTPDEIVSLAWKALSFNDSRLALEVLDYCKYGKILGEAATRKLGEETLAKINRLAHRQGDAR